MGGEGEEETKHAVLGNPSAEYGNPISWIVGNRGKQPTVSPINT